MIKHIYVHTKDDEIESILSVLHWEVRNQITVKTDPSRLTPSYRAYLSPPQRGHGMKTHGTKRSPAFSSRAEAARWAVQKVQAGEW